MSSKCINLKVFNFFGRNVEMLKEVNWTWNCDHALQDIFHVGYLLFEYKIGEFYGYNVTFSSCYIRNGWISYLGLGARLDTKNLVRPKIRHSAGYRIYYMAKHSAGYRIFYLKYSVHLINIIIGKITEIKKIKTG